MPSYKVAHVREQGVQLIIVPLDPQFEYRNSTEQQNTIAALQMRATAAGMAGTVVPVWNRSDGRMRFVAPPNWHPFFKNLNFDRVLASINRKLYW